MVNVFLQIKFYEKKKESKYLEKNNYVNYEFYFRDE